MPRNTDMNDLEVNLDEIHVDFLDTNITKDEILKAISSCNRNKAASTDKIVATLKTSLHHT
jgi:hypothetical protein